MTRKILIVAIVLFGIAQFSVAKAVTTTIPTSTPGINISELSLGIPGTHDVKEEGIPGLVANIYDLALMLAGLLAFGSIVYGGIIYLSQPGNHEAQSQAKDRIRDAILGLLLLIGLYAVMNIINPDLTHLRFPSLQRLAPADQLTIDGAEALPVELNKDYYACRERTTPEHKILMCYATEKDCVASCFDPKKNKAPGQLSDQYECAVVKGTQCAATNPTQGSCPVPGLTPLSGDALQMENGLKVSYASGVPEIQSNLYALNTAVAQFKALLAKHGATLTVNSAYRPEAYQRHFYEIFTAYNQLQGNMGSGPDCKDLKAQITAEHDKHGLRDQVAAPNQCAPHVKGIAVDLDISIPIAEAARILDTEGAAINLQWRNYAGDPVHFELKKPPAKVPGC